MSSGERTEDIRIIAEQVRWQRMNLGGKIGSIALAVAIIPYVVARNALRSIRRKSPENPKP